MNGKKTCKILKDIRQRIAQENDIKLITEECRHKGDCQGTCPKCEAEVRFLESELNKRSQLGKAITLTGLAFTMSSCNPFVNNHTMGIVPATGQDTPPEEYYQLEGDVSYIPEENEENESGETNENLAPAEGTEEKDSLRSK
ncbi:MAG: hypothetical protein J6Y37_03145 [Paludibacteraceae bacterium]|nr:hypothetical protein [Paludibacteraceae bacterium]